MCTKFITIYSKSYGIFYRGQIAQIRNLYSHHINKICLKHSSLVSTNTLQNYNMPDSYPLCVYSSQYKAVNQIKSKETDKNAQQVIKTDIHLSRKEKLKKAVREYGSTVIVFHVGISLISLGTCYILVSLGLDVAAIFDTFGFDEWAKNSKIATNAGTFAVAYGIHKVFAPVRIGITLASVPLIVRYLRKIGFLKK